LEVVEILAGVGVEVVSTTRLRGIANSLKYRLREGVYAIFMVVASVPLPRKARRYLPYTGGI
jgi:hypothetical protein